MNFVGFMVLVPFVVHFASDLRSHSLSFFAAVPNGPRWFLNRS